MKNKFNSLLSYFDNLNFNYKTAFLVFIIAGGMICIIILSQISIFTMKQDFDILFDKRTKSLMQLENIKDSYKVNIQDSLMDFEKKQINYQQTIEVLTLAQEIIDKNWSLYQDQSQFENKELLTTFIKTFIIKEENYYENNTLKNSIIQNINKKREVIKNELNHITLIKSDDYFINLNLEINSISIYLTSLINYDLNLAINEKRNTDKIFNTIIIFSIISIFIVFLFSVILSLLIIDNFRKLHNSLEQKVNEKTKELQNLNNYLETKISKEVLQNRRKDIIMFQQARFASLGEMLNNIAHQWRQPLSLISTIASGIKIQMEFGLFDEKDVIPDMDNIIKQTTYLSNTIDDFRNFIKNSNEKGEVQISNIIHKTLSILNPSIVNHNIKIILNTHDNIEIIGYENQLIQALINILNNAKDALKEKVKSSEDKLIFIETKNVQDGLVLKIKDNAGGIPENVIDKIFEPYFTTKHKSIGTGIGLSMTHQIIIKHHNANIFASNETYEYENKTYTGACFTIIFKNAKELIQS